MNERTQIGGLKNIWGLNRHICGKMIQNHFGKLETINGWRWRVVDGEGNNYFNKNEKKQRTKKVKKIKTRMQKKNLRQKEENGNKEWDRNVHRDLTNTLTRLEQFKSSRWLMDEDEELRTKKKIISLIEKKNIKR